MNYMHIHRSSPSPRCTKIVRFYAVCLLLLCAAKPALYAEQMHSPAWGYSVDFPEAFRLTYKQAETSYQFEHDVLPVTLIIRSWPEAAASGEKMKDVLKKLKAAGEAEDIIWRGRTCTIALFDMPTKTGVRKGWAACIPHDEEKGITLISGYAPETHFAQAQSLIVSALDSFSPQSSNPNTSGIMTSFAYPKQGPRHANLTIGTAEIPVVFDLADSEAHNALIEREYNILTLFADTPLQEKAWQRYYRMIYRDAYKRLEKAAFTIYNVLEAEVRAENTGTPADKDRALAQKLLSWTQTLPYERRRNSSDFTSLIDTLTGTGSDCDSRALLLAVLMSHMNYNTMLFISPHFSHAFFGIDIEGKGARLEHAGTNYLLGETTAQVDLGLVPQDMSDSTKWFGIAGLGR
ncbi:hypothetical protein V1L52_03660 [Treponema sp. HNW]|uniref:hypothetical protein n=1 Tax=Treponema sp. HNW TaxID=3116654 RepID=UPI003D0D109D